MHNFQKLHIYRKALALSKTVREITKSFPKDELFSLTTQFRRASYSIVLNIAEGAGNRSTKEFLKFLDYSIRSAHECVACNDIALVNEFVKTETHTELHKQIDELIAMLIGFQRSLSQP